MNVLDLYYDIDNLGFIKNIERPILEEYLSFHNSISLESSTINKELIEERIGYLYAQRIFLEDIRGVKSNHNFFEVVLKKIEKEYGVNVESISLNSSGFMTIHSINPHRRILSILSRRKKELFKIFDHKYEDVSIDIRMKMKEIDVNTGIEDEKLYLQLNKLIGRTRSVLCLDFEKCNNEIKRITNIIRQNENSLALLDGL